MSSAPTSGNLPKNSPESSSDDEADDSTRKPRDFKELVKRYGTVGTLFHTIVWGGTLGAFYVGIKLGFDVQVLTPYLERIPYVHQDMLPSDASEFLVAYTLTIATSPVRFAVDAVVVPQLAKYVRKTGMFDSS